MLRESAMALPGGAAGRLAAAGCAAEGGDKGAAESAAAWAMAQAMAPDWVRESERGLARVPAKDWPTAGSVPSVGAGVRDRAVVGVAGSCIGLLSLKFSVFSFQLCEDAEGHVEEEPGEGAGH